VKNKNGNIGKADGNPFGGCEGREEDREKKELTGSRKQPTNQSVDNEVEAGSHCDEASRESNREVWET
jgi:hypothetical protein